VSSRDFVCVRLLTYENETESAFLNTLGPSGVMNTSFVMLAPDGKTKLSGAGRAPRQVYRGNPLDGMLAALASLKKKYPGNGKAPVAGSIPYLVDVRRALNVASCDGQPLVVVSGKKAEAALAKLAWSDAFRGRFAWVRANKDLHAIAGTPKKDAVMVVDPGVYGVSGKVIGSTTKTDAASLRAMFDKGLRTYQAPKKGTAEIKEGQRQGLSWKSESMKYRPADANGRGRR
jgi:hypothetical protein